MLRIAFRVSFAAFPLYLGVFLPYLMLPVLGRTVNLAWGFVYGVGMLITDVSLANTGVLKWLSFGTLLWPILVTAFLYWMSGKIWSRSETPAIIAACAVGISALLVIPMDTASRPPFVDIPTYWNLMFPIY
jgi:hypothetical protein